MCPPRSNSTRSVRASMMTSATRPENLMSLAPMVSSTISSARSLRCLRARFTASIRPATCEREEVEQGVPVPGLRAFGDGLRAEEAGGDGCARAGQRNEGDGEMRVLDREAERGAHLVAVKRTVAGARVPARALPRPSVGMRIGAVDNAGPVAVEPGAAGPVEFAGIRAEEATETEAAFGELHRPVGIAFAGGDRIAHARDHHVAHENLGDHALGSAVGQRDVDGGGGRLAVSDAQSAPPRRRRS